MNTTRVRFVRQRYVGGKKRVNFETWGGGWMCRCNDSGSTDDSKGRSASIFRVKQLNGSCQIHRMTA
jgi:hypothetical protein